MLSLCVGRWLRGCATPATQSAAASQAPKPDQARHPVPSVPRLPRKTTVDVTLCHACHAPVPLGLSSTAPRHRCGQAQEKQTQGDESGPSAPRSAICPTPATQNDGGCEFVPRLPRETKCVCVCVCVWTKCLCVKCVWTKCV